MAKNYSKLATRQDFRVEGARLHGRGETLQIDYHAYLMQIAAKWANDGDAAFAVAVTNEFLDGTPGSVRCDAMRAWVENFFGFVWNIETKQFVSGKKKGGPKGDLSLTDMNGKRFWEFKPPSEYKGIDFKAKLLQLVNTAEKRAGKPNKADDIDPALLAAAKALVVGKAA